MVLKVRVLLIGLVLLLTILAFLIYRFVGLNLVQLSLDQSRKSSPLLILRLDDVQPGVSFESHYKDFLYPRELLLRSSGGESIMTSQPHVVASGPESYTSSYLSVYVVDKGQTFVDLVTSPAYITLENGVADSLANSQELVGALSPNLQLDGDLGLVLAHIHRDAQDEFRNVIEVSASSHAGVLLYAEEMVYLFDDGDSKFNFLAIASFANRLLLYEWLRDELRKSLFIEHATNMDSLVVLTLETPHTFWNVAETEMPETFSETVQ